MVSSLYFMPIFPVTIFYPQKLFKPKMTQPELQHMAYPNIAYTIGWKKQQLTQQINAEHILLHILCGELQIQEAENGRIFRAGETVLVRRNHLVKCGTFPLPGGVPYEVVVFILDKELLRDYALKNNLNQEEDSRKYPGVFSLQNTPALSSLFDSLEPYRISGKPLSEAMKRHKLEEAIIALLEQQENLQQILFDFGDPGKIDLKEFMLRNYMFNIPIKKFAHLTGRSLSTFQRDFQKIFGMNASHWLLRHRLQAAHEALSIGQKRPSDIYLEVGFGDMSHFSKSFKTQFGYNPSYLSKQSVH